HRWYTVEERAKKLKPHLTFFGFAAVLKTVVKHLKFKSVFMFGGGFKTAAKPFASTRIGGGFRTAGKPSLNG
ncbi:hypothetical protein PIB30_110151, partial [Stylosanthes scabra]|nr:hypothetical protein [Stylosanthes scabra]